MSLPSTTRQALDSFDIAQRRQAVADLMEGGMQPAPRDPLHVNLHCHTFYSYNGYGASPCHVAAEAVDQGWYAAGICDFDVLDGLEEFIWAGDQLRLRATVNLETRVFFREYADNVINSPGEPGIYYFMGAGFVSLPPPGEPTEQLAAMRAGAAQRTRDVVARVNDFLGDLVLDFDADVLPLPPAGNATERHVCTAYYEKSRRELPTSSQWAAFWADKLGIEEAAAARLYGEPMAFSDKARSALIKAGGPGYVEPTPETFPPLDDVIAMVRASRAIPTGTWLDGTNDGEADMASQLDCLMEKGVEALNIIPDRNWNLPEGPERQQKIAKFHECVEIANRLDLPLNVGTELNKYGQRWVDDFTALPMQAVADSFVRGARIMVGHTRLLRFADLSYIDETVRAEFGGDRGKQNDFFAAVGALPPPRLETLERLLERSADQNYATLQDAVRRGCW